MTEEQDAIEKNSKTKEVHSDSDNRSSPESISARLTSNYELGQAEKARTNPSDGSLGRYQSVNPKSSKQLKDLSFQNQSIELVDGDVSVSRANPLKERDLPRGVNANGTHYQVYTASSSQAFEGPGRIDRALTEGPFQSSVKLNVQVTNVPEVSTGLKAEEVLGYFEHVMQAGAESVRPVKEHLSQSNAANQDICNLPNQAGDLLEHFAQSPEQLNQDVITVTGRLIEAIDKPISKDVRAVAAGRLMSFFFFEGEPTPINSETVQQMKLEQMAEKELKGLGIEKKEMHMPEVPPEVSNLELQRSSPELLKNMEAKGRTFVMATEGSEELAYMQAMHVNGIASGANKTEIWLKENPFKIASLEEFLHGTQARHGWFECMPEEIAEFKVKDFMIRHRKMLGLDENDCAVLRIMRQREKEYAIRRGFSVYEIEVKRWISPAK